jgi:hypothetical protein
VPGLRVHPELDCLRHPVRRRRLRKIILRVFYAAAKFTSDLIRAPKAGVLQSSGRHAGIGRANLSALRRIVMAFAFHTEIGIDNVDIPFRNGVNRALGHTNAASHAIFTDFKRQS